MWTFKKAKENKQAKCLHMEIKNDTRLSILKSTKQISHIIAKQNRNYLTYQETGTPLINQLNHTNQISVMNKQANN